MKYLFLIYIMFIHIFSYADVVNFSDLSEKKEYKFSINCDKNFEKCELNSILNKKSSKYYGIIPKKSNIKFIGNNISELVLTCGSFCLKSIYFDLEHKWISNVFYMPVKIDVKNKLVISSGEDDNKLKLSEIFGKKEVNIERNYSFVNPVSNAIDQDETQFLPNDKLKLTYEIDDDDYKTEIIDLKSLGF